MDKAFVGYISGLSKCVHIHYHPYGCGYVSEDAERSEKEHPSGGRIQNRLERKGLTPARDARHQ